MFIGLVQVGCQTNERDSILVLAVEDLSFNDLNCNQERDERSGIQILCAESVRFTHSFTPSTLAVPTLSSLMTGLYPFQHGVHHNGSPPLAAEYDTVAELALRQEYRTSFFSGGAPVLRKSGLNQGFEFFDDNFTPTLTSLYKPFKKNIENFLTWARSDAGSTPYFSVLYVPDLIFTNTQTSTDMGEARNLSFESQLDEFDENLFDLITALKKEHRWDRTTLILVGLSGRAPAPRIGELVPMNLHSENTQVALMIKPAQAKKRDEAMAWKVDRNVTLVDVGRTLFEMLGESRPEQMNSDFPTYSLLSLLKSPNSDIPEDRPLLLESGWAFWREAGPIRTAVIASHVLYINDREPGLFNTLVDRFEVNPLPLLQESILPFTNKAQRLLRKNDFPAFSPLDSEWNAKLSLPFTRWMRPEQEVNLLRDLRRLLSQKSHSQDLLNWTGQIALNQRDWELLKNLGTKHKIALWQYVGEKNLNVKNAKVSEVCFDLLTSKTIDTNHLKGCTDTLFLEFVDWVRADIRGLNKEAQRTRFERSFRNYILDQQIQRANIAMGMLWDTARENVYSPSRTELALNLPENTKIKNQLYRSLATPEE
jgi:Arylsulfatase A and related enzymes